MTRIITREFLIKLRNYLRARLTDKSKRLVPASFSERARKNYLRRRNTRTERIKIILALPEDNPHRQALYAKLKQRADKIGWRAVMKRYGLPENMFPRPEPKYNSTLRNCYTPNKAQQFADACRGILPECDSYHPELRGFLERHLGPSFTKVLKRLLDKKGMSAPELYTEIGMDRKLFSKIMGDKNYHPSKKSVILLALGLRLDEAEAIELLRVGGYYLSDACCRDLIVTYCLQNKIYDVYLVDELLDEFGAGSLHRAF